jgi:hypothetical protein
MSNAPSVSPEDVIHVGSGMTSKLAVVCNTYDDGRVEVVYFDSRRRPIAEPVRWTGRQWAFEHPGPGGTHADQHGRLLRYVAILRREHPG